MHLFISDLHLTAERPEANERFFRFIEDKARDAAALYVLGDLFEVWIGDDDLAGKFNSVVVGFFAALVKSGTPLYLMHGNRDFLMGRRFSRATGATLLKDPSVVDVDGTPTLLMHGDTLCTDDVEYQKFRGLVRNPVWQQQFLAKPVAERRAFAAQARGESRKQTAMKAAEIMDVDQGAVESVMRTHGVRRLIHGHTHRLATHRFDLDGQTAERIVLGDWYEQGSVLRASPEGFALTRL